MSNKKNIAIVIAIGHIVFSSVAMDRQSVGLKESYQDLLKAQGTVDPIAGIGQRHIDKTKGMLDSEQVYHQRNQFESIFKEAAKTGLVAQYKRLLTTQQGIAFLANFISPEHLQVVAYMQNKYGQGNPFEYDGKYVGIVFADPKIGDYVNPFNKTIVMTRYSFFNGLLDAAIGLANDPQMKSNVYLKEILRTMSSNLAQAGANASVGSGAHKFSALAKKAEELIAAKNEAAIVAIDTYVNKPLEKIINQYSKK